MKTKEEKKKIIEKEFEALLSRMEDQTYRLMCTNRDCDAPLFCEKPSSKAKYCKYCKSVLEIIFPKFRY